MGWSGTEGPDWVERPAHRLWLLDQARGLFDLFRPALDPAGGFHPLDLRGQPLGGAAGRLRQIHDTTRMVHCYTLARELGLPGADRMIDHGMQTLWSRHRDPRHGGYVWSFDPDGPVNASKQAYGHAFVLLAAASARVAGHPDADRLLADVGEVIRHRFWDAAAGARARSSPRTGIRWAPTGARIPTCT